MTAPSNFPIISFCRANLDLSVYSFICVFLYIRHIQDTSDVLGPFLCLHEDDSNDSLFLRQCWVIRSEERGQGELRPFPHWGPLHNGPPAGHGTGTAARTTPPENYKASPWQHLLPEILSRKSSPYLTTAVCWLPCICSRSS